MWKVVFISVLGVGLCSCSSLPKGGAGPMIPSARIIEAVRCQLASAFAPGNPDPAGIINWKMLATVTINADSGYEIRPGIAGLAGKSGKASWVAPGAGVGFTDVTTRKTSTECKVQNIPGAIASGPCPAPDTPDASRGLGVGAWLREATAGQPAPGTGATPGQMTYKKTYTVDAKANGGLTLTFADYSLTFQGNKANLTNTYTVDVRLGPQTGATAPFAVGVEFGLNTSGQFDDFSDLRAQRDKDEDDETIIKVPPGQSIIIQ